MSGWRPMFISHWQVQWCPSGKTHMDYNGWSTDKEGRHVLPLGRSCHYWLHWVDMPWEEGSGHAWLLFEWVFVWLQGSLSQLSQVLGSHRCQIGTNSKIWAPVAALSYTTHKLHGLFSSITPAPHPPPSFGVLGLDDGGKIHGFLLLLPWVPGLDNDSQAFGLLLLLRPVQDQCSFGGIF